MMREKNVEEKVNYQKKRVTRRVQTSSVFLSH